MPKLKPPMCQVVKVRIHPTLIRLKNVSLIGHKHATCLQTCINSPRKLGLDSFRSVLQASCPCSIFELKVGLMLQLVKTNTVDTRYSESWKTVHCMKFLHYKAKFHHIVKIFDYISSRFAIRAFGYFEFHGGI